jgi:hypothetical protein
LSISQHTWWPITFGTEENNYLVDPCTVLYYRLAMLIMHASLFITSAVRSSYQRHESFVPS